MSGWVYRLRHNDAGRAWQVGFFDPAGDWCPVRTYEGTALNEISAQDLTHYLNGGDLRKPATVDALDEQLRRRKFP